MVYKWRPRPAWLKKVYYNPEPVFSERAAPNLKVFWGHLETISWTDLLVSATLSENEPGLLYFSSRQKQRAKKQRFSSEAKSRSDLIGRSADESKTWKELLGEVPAERPNVTVTVSWKDLVKNETRQHLTLIKTDNEIVKTISWADLVKGSTEGE